MDKSLQRRGLRGSPGRNAVKEHLAAGFPVYVGDRSHPGQIIKIHPDGRRELVVVDDAGTITVLSPAPVTDSP